MPASLEHKSKCYMHLPPRRGVAKQQAALLGLTQSQVDLGQSAAAHVVERLAEFGNCCACITLEEQPPHPH